MKPLFSICASLLLLAGATACSKTDATPQPPFFVQATKDLNSWTATGTGTFSKTTQQFYIFGQLGESVITEYLSLGFSLPASPQLAPVQTRPATWVTLVGGDVVTNSYATADAASLPALEITRLDTVAKVVEGRFQATLVRDKRWTMQTEVIRFTHGSFRVQYTTVP
jgi:outer membrane biogenesis lipoprotein LolB